MKKKYKDGFERRKEHSKENIRRAALELFSQFGVERVSIADIAKKAGVSQATIYNNFDGKDALARDFVNFMVNQLIENTQSALSPDLPFEEKISAFVGFISEAFAQGPPGNADRVFLSSSFDLQTDPEMREIRDTAKRKMIVLLTDVVREGKDQNLIQGDISEEAFAIYFDAFMDIFMKPKIQTKLFSDPKLVSDLTTLLLKGLR